MDVIIEKVRYSEVNTSEKLSTDIKNKSNNAQIIKTKENSTHCRKRKPLAFDEWLALKKGFKRHTWSYAFDGGILISYYDSGSTSRPSYCNPKPWIL
ncbi:hypothetical protein AVEN_43897-1 [Araneus ventricosus]|uniref:Uncharacterized protein n=1 Tax=Araneus ventricosus TaxID=182803 RepID=A0A4Y2JY30_ARAVE|nr:hypothetical protein AVEN_43897-1 [Araneus ventricosus]